ncbi:PepSY domain-containing protein [Ruegeria arenilitoris]|uniref:PepSY domain-containing protein n=1 Tax=Ruegeria arenilitoris TaxID=1173585 RepID=UPI001C2C1622|nr:hypothetical protein [Ruegeria arenilitoris]
MKTFLILACLLSLLVAGDAHADAQELRQSELRKATTSGQAIRLNRVIKGVERVFGGTPVDARAFKTDEIFYRILVKKPDGVIQSVIVNAKTGIVVSNRSSVGRQISRAAQNSAGSVKSTTSFFQNSNRNSNAFGSRSNSGNRGNSGEGGNGNSGGNGNGNSGGNGNGNSGGNGNGNSGGNGNGNSGGNGNGNSGGNGNGNSGGNGNGNSGGNGNGNSGGNGNGNAGGNGNGNGQENR